MGRKPKAQPEADEPEPVKASTRGDLDAAAVLKRLQSDAGTLVRKIDSAQDRLDALMELGGNVQEKDAIAKVQNELANAKEEWWKVSKNLLAYDKGVAEEKREGEKVTVAEARELFAQLMLSMRLAVEQVVVASSQSAALCDSPEAFCEAHAGNMRAAMDGVLSAARKEGVLPKWIL